MRIEFTQFQDIVAFRTGSRVNANTVIDAIIEHLANGIVILTMDDRDVANLRQNENGEWIITFIN